jgi:hypothetical protein
MKPQSTVHVTHSSSSKAHNGSSSSSKKVASKSSSSSSHHHHKHSDSSEDEGEKIEKVEEKKKPKKSHEISDEEEPKMKIHKKPDANGFHKAHSNSKEEEAHHSKLTDMALDVKSDESKEKGDFKLFNLSKDLTEKLKGSFISQTFNLKTQLNNSIFLKIY